MARGQHTTWVASAQPEAGERGSNGFETHGRSINHRERATKSIGGRRAPAVRIRNVMEQFQILLQNRITDVALLKERGDLLDPGIGRDDLGQLLKGAFSRKGFNQLCSLKTGLCTLAVHDRLKHCAQLRDSIRLGEHSPEAVFFVIRHDRVI
jgi:hypothetical protein